MGFVRRISIRPEQATGTCLLLLFFLAPGAYLLVRLPEIPWAQLSCFLLLGIATVIACIPVAPIHLPKRRIWFITALFVLPALVSQLANPFIKQQLLYDIYGEMPSILWLLFPLVFLLSASLSINRWLRFAIKTLVIVGMLLLMISVGQRLAGMWVSVFGSVAYSISAFTPLPPLLLWLSFIEKKQTLLWRTAALLSTLAIAYLSYGLLGILAAIFLFLFCLALAPQLCGIPEGTARIWLRRGASIAVAGLILAICLVLTPVVSQHFLNQQQLSTFGTNVRSRVELSYGAQRMFFARPFFGWGPAGYRLNAVRFLNAEIFADTASLGSDPLAYSPPSPHSLLWEVLTRVGIVGALAFGLAAVLWWREFQSKKKDEPRDIVALRNATAIATFSWLATLLVTPQHFASSFLGVACAGLTIAPLARTRDKKGRDFPFDRLLVIGRIALIVLVGFALFGLVRQQAGIAASETLVSDANEDLARLEQIAEVVPNHPLLERRMIDDRLLTCDTLDENNALLAEALVSPGYISDFGPNLVNFARLGMDNLEQFDSDDVSAIRPLLARAEELMPDTPALLGERLHVALIVGNTKGIQEAAKQFRPVARLYPLGKGYLSRISE